MIAVSEFEDQLVVAGIILILVITLIIAIMGDSTPSQ